MATRAAVSEVRAWAKQQGFAIGDRGRLPTEVWQAWEAASAVVPGQRVADDAARDELAAQVAAALQRVEHLEEQVRGLTDRLATVEGAREAPRRRFARR